MKADTIRLIFKCINWGLLFLFRFISPKKKYLKAKATIDSWDDEKEDIIERANWLEDIIITEPHKLIRRMPSVLGRFYQGQWAIYSCSFYAASLVNISKLYPEKKEECLKRLEKIIDIVDTPEIRYYDTMSWKEDAMETISGNKSHMTYLSILAWIITNYKILGGKDKYDTILHKCCEALNRRMLQSKDLNLPSFPNKIVFLPDMMVAIIALKNYSDLFEGQYNELVKQWLEKLKTEWTNKKTGLIISGYYSNGKKIPLRGSYSALNCYYLSLIDESFAKEQYLLMKKHLNRKVSVCNKKITGIKEYANKTPKLKLDPDAGPIAFGLSPSGTAWAIGCATLFHDWDFRYQLLASGEIVGVTRRKKNKRHYKLGEIAITGEAVALAMKTHIK